MEVELGCGSVCVELAALCAMVGGWVGGWRRLARWRVVLISLSYRGSLPRSWGNAVGGEEGEGRKMRHQLRYDAIRAPNKSILAFIRFQHVQKGNTKSDMQYHSVTLCTFWSLGLCFVFFSLE